jgi:hypothetical protein
MQIKDFNQTKSFTFLNLVTMARTKKNSLKPNVEKPDRSLVGEGKVLKLFSYFFIPGHMNFLEENYASQKGKKFKRRKQRLNLNIFCVKSKSMI